jgi:arsenite oxidase small subunit
MEETLRLRCYEAEPRRRFVLGLMSLPLLALRTAPAIAADESVATLAELAKPWSAVRFTLKDGGEELPCIVIRLPDGGWYASSLICPHNKCDIAYVTDAEAARDNFNVDVAAPVLACPCHFSVFDPAGHGAVIAGPAPNPPQQLSVTVRGDQVFVSR